MSIAQGSRQRYNLERLLDGHCIRIITTHNSRYDAKFGGAYHAFNNFIKRARQAGYVIDGLPGPKLGWSNAHYRLRSSERPCAQCEEVYPRYAHSLLSGRRKG